MSPLQKTAIFCLFGLLHLVTGLHAEAPINGDEALIRLAEGNRRFVATSEMTLDTKTVRTQMTSDTKKPLATVLTCSDAKIPPEIIFGRELGELFVVRLAGNVVDDLALATIEFGVGTLETPLLVVLGHNHCETVEAAIKTTENEGNGLQPRLLAELRPSVIGAKARRNQDENTPLLDLAIQANATASLHKILDKSPLITQRLLTGKLKVASGVYHVEDGEVKWLLVRGL